MCNALLHTATHCITLHDTATHWMCTSHKYIIHVSQCSTHCNPLHHTASHCNTLQHTATHCNTLQHTATHYKLCSKIHLPRESVHAVFAVFTWLREVVPHTDTSCATWVTVAVFTWLAVNMYGCTCRTWLMSHMRYPYDATLIRLCRDSDISRDLTCSCAMGLIHACYCSTLQHIAVHGNGLQHSAIHCNTLQCTAIHCNTLQHIETLCSTLQHTVTHAAHCNTLQHDATHCNILQQTAAHCKTL